ncbi:MAG: Peptidoglycan DL-endopeptidase CwlO [Candidatus Giovannonibacteria bacterium GW2011_GWA2_44_26]|uniref:Peptidoglycan DL-endopeptidase CwlO n=1 Tax=Candidatus Giovannonibacteria bacterium GW2011_GWA2_44_26 TaxID=1618648 RepID=A0A0G1LPD2_9BACT|nr:MAG: Peptidoglycan DL-endopeptidase CwlO [Candidatus Giovannonibacteria bacterium GW2011_GWA2_44_26]
MRNAKHEIRSAKLRFYHKFPARIASRLLLFFVLLFTFYFFLSDSFAEEIDQNAISQRRQQLEEELEKLENQIDGYRSVIQEKQREATTFERDIAIIDAQISKAKLEIKARNLSIAKLGEGIGDKKRLIGDLSVKLEQEKDSLAELLRRANELDSTSLIEVVLGYEKLSDFFSETDNFESIQKALQQSFDEIKQTKTDTENEKQELENRKSEETELRYLQEFEKKRKEEVENAKKNLLKQTKGQEKEYQKILSSRQKDAATIRSQLFVLRGSPAIPFEKALNYANMVYKSLGIRPAFLLGVIAEESNLGANIGTGDWKIELAHSKCSKQREAFLNLTSSLGLNPDLMPVSKRAWYGNCGGAMGPAQFMPTTWLLYKNRIAQYAGHNPPNPWEPLDAFFAAGLYLKDSGAGGGTYAAERKAALKYLAGGNWSKPAYSFYGDDVMALAAKYQEQIDIITKP